jgi:two-component system copper resistance phosphate regulon response regulator CusR
MRILVIEDEPKTGDYLKRGLTENGFVVDVVRDGVEGRFHAITGDYQLVILDVGLPKLDGWQVLADLRRQKDTPVLFLTARDKVEDRVKGLELGAGASRSSPKCSRSQTSNSTYRAIARSGPAAAST